MAIPRQIRGGSSRRCPLVKSRFQCTKHDSRYSPDGEHTAGRATRNLDRYPVRKNGTSIVVLTDTVYRSDQNAAAWAAAAIDV
jgi:hypothetical protein